jgi:hypothetical protein
MGYETRMYVCECFDDPFGGELTFSQILGMVDLCKMGHQTNAEILRSWVAGEQGGNKLAFFYGTDGETKIDEDDCGEPLVVIDPQEFLDALLKDIEAAEDKGEHPYRRFVMAASLLENTIPYFPKKTLKILTFGH